MKKKTVKQFSQQFFISILILFTCEKNFALPSDTSTLRNSRPNIIIIILDDCRWDAFAPNGGPSFFHSPAINRIADEGVNFTNAFTVLSLCSPSRASILTGLYPHKHGIHTNTDDFNQQVPNIADILHGNGYYCGIVGKFAFEFRSLPAGFDYYLLSEELNYFNSLYIYNSPALTTLPGHTTDVLTDGALDFLDHAADHQPFFLYLSHRAPHIPLEPRAEDDEIFDHDSMPYPDNPQPYTANVPSFLYPENENTEDSIEEDSLIRGYYEMLAGAEASTQKVIDYLEAHHLLDNTLIIFTSDNGILKKEHDLAGKQLPNEESMRVPMFVRYPEWFPPHTVVSDQLALNIDIPQTVLDAAGIPALFGMDGVSLKALADHTQQRNEFLYEIYRDGTTPDMRAVRTTRYKYIYSFCSDTTEQCFDLKNDPKENTNLINDPGFQPLINYYRCKLDSMRTATGDDNEIEKIDCSLLHADLSSTGIPMDTLQLHECKGALANSISNLMLFPNPTYDELNFHFKSDDFNSGHLRIVNALGQTMQEDFIAFTPYDFEYEVPLKPMSDGVYFVFITLSKQKYAATFVVKK